MRDGNRFYIRKIVSQFLAKNKLEIEICVRGKGAIFCIEALENWENTSTYFGEFRSVFIFCCSAQIGNIGPIVVTLPNRQKRCPSVS